VRSMSSRIVGIVCLSLGMGAAQAAPITYQFTATPQGYGFGYPSELGPIDVPAPFDDSDWVYGSRISGSFTIDTDVVPLTGSQYIDGVLVPTGNWYRNPITQMSLDVGDQHFDFVSVRPSAGSTIRESSIIVSDLPYPSSNPMNNRDGLDLNVNFGTELLPGAFSHLATSFSMVRSERDLSAITSRDMVENLVFTPNWSTFFSLHDGATGSYYQIHAPLTSLTRVASVPEPGTELLLALGLGLAGSRIARRKQVPAL
jgi:hypothetical protein